MKIRQLKSSLSKVGFVPLKRRGKGNHSVWIHATNRIKIVLSGKDNNDAKHYQIKDLERAIAQVYVSF